MPAVVALAIRSLIQIAVTFGLMTLAEKYVLPLINRSIAAIMEVFGVPEEDAKDIMSNEILIFAETIGIGALVLRTKIPTKISEYLGFTSKGWGKRPLSGKAATVKSGTTASGIIVPGGVIVPTAIESSAIILKAKNILPGFAAASNVLAKTLGLTFLGFIAFNNLVDFGNWNSGAYQKTFQKIFAKITGGLLVPDEDYRKTKTVSPDVFDKVYNTYKLEGVIGINDPYKKQSLVFSRDNLIDLLDIVGADLLRTTQRASTKDVLLASQLFMVFSESQEAPKVKIAVSRAAALPKTKVFTGIVSQGKLGETAPFTAREDDLIDSIDDLQNAAANNLSNFIMALPGKIVYEIKIVSSVTTKDGFIQRGTSQQIISGYTAAGAAKYKTIVNKFAVVDIFVFTERNIRTKIQRIVLGPVDSVSFQPKTDELQMAEQNIKTNLTTSDISEIQIIKSDQYIEIKPTETAAEKTITEDEFNKIFGIAASYHFFADVDKKLYSGLGALLFETDYREAARDLSQKRDIIKAKGLNPQLVEPYKKRENDFFALNVLASTYKGWPGEEIKTQPKEPILTAYQFARPQETLPSAAIPPSNNPNKCLASNIAEYFDPNRSKYPNVKERSIIYEAFDLGPANWYTGTAEQNIKLLAELKNRSGC